MIYRRLVKPLADIIFGFFFLLLSSPIILFLYLFSLMKFGSGFFSQKRLGAGNIHFNLYKIRTLPLKAPESGRSLTNPFMQFVRQYGLDELPQLINVLKGDMSLVGPRPLLIEYEKNITEQYPERSRLRPGLTGWVQIKGRNSLKWERKFDLDIWYVQNQSFLLDLRILVSTFIMLFKDQKADPGNTDSVPAFKDIHKE